jgi:hypothetical protein
MAIEALENFIRQHYNEDPHSQAIIEELDKVQRKGFQDIKIVEFLEYLGINYKSYPKTFEAAIAILSAIISDNLRTGNFDHAEKAFKLWLFIKENPIDLSIDAYYQYLITLSNEDWKDRYMFYNYKHKFIHKTYDGFLKEAEDNSTSSPRSSNFDAYYR